MSSRIKSVDAPPLVDLMKLSNETAGCISLAQGVPSYSPPRKLLERFSDMIIADSSHGYTPDPGLPELRQSISGLLRKDFKLEAPADEIVVTPGANQAFINVILTLCSPGDKVVLLSPYYFNHKMALDMFGFIPVIVNLENDFSLNYNELRSQLTDVTAIVLVNPGNPSGYSFSSTQLKEIAEVISEVAPNTWVISDETYNYFNFYSDHFPMRRFYEKTITVSSFSKSFGIPGWRLGYYHIPHDLVTESIKVQDTTVICAPNITQRLGAFLIEHRDEFLKEFIECTKQNHKIASEELTSIDILDLPPHNAAYYIFPKVSTYPSMHRGFSLAKKLVRDHKVAIVPGEVFGNKWGDNFRVSFANVDGETLTEGLHRLRRALLER